MSHISSVVYEGKYNYGTENTIMAKIISTKQDEKLT